MINDLNRVALMGYLGADAVQKSSAAPVTFSLATTSRWTDNAGKRQSRTEWHNIVIFNALAKYAITFKKGDRVYLEAELRYSKYSKTVGAETVNLTSTEVHAIKIDRLAAKAEEAEAESTEFAAPDQPDQSEEPVPAHHE